MKTIGPWTTEPRHRLTTTSGLRRHGGSARGRQSEMDDVFEEGVYEWAVGSASRRVGPVQVLRLATSYKGIHEQVPDGRCCPQVREERSSG